MTFKGARVQWCMLVLSILFAVACALMPLASGSERSADAVFTNGYVYTADSHHTVAQAIAVRDGAIIFVGSNAGAKAFVGPKTIVVNLAAKMMLPGFTDAHCHADSGGIQDLYEISFTDVNNPTIQDYLRRLADFVKARPDLPGYRGMGWLNGAAPGIGPLATDLDTVVRDKPVVLRSQDGHSVWVNSKALELAHVTRGTPDPLNGKIERLPDGTPSGTLREAAMGPMGSVIPPYTLEQYEAAILHFQKEIAGPFGITQVFIPGLAVNGIQMSAYEQLARAGKLTVRFRAAATLNPGEVIADQIHAAVAERARHTDPLFQVNSIKLFVDGVIEGHTGYLLRPYADAQRYNGNQNYRGMPMWSPEDLDAASAAASRAGFLLHYHAIGDAAARMALDAIMSAEKAVGRTDMRPAITHLQLVDPADLARFKTLGAVAVTQPYWFVSDKDYFWNIQVPYLGKVRADHEYPMRSFFREGVLVASSSDYPVTLPPNPLAGIETGVLRWYQGISKGSEILWPSEHCTVRQMIDSFTINGSKSMLLEKTSGSIEVGKSADFIILSRNILKIPPKLIGDSKHTRVLATYFQGKKVFDAGDIETAMRKALNVQSRARKQAGPR
jgi:predicted amidohydrolase YtcJ